MKKIIGFIEVIVLIVTSFYFLYKKFDRKEVKEEKKEIKEEAKKEEIKQEEKKETKGVSISYIEYEEYFNNKNEVGIEEEIKNMINNLNKYSINTVYLQVRMFSDSIYKSNIFPFTDVIDSRSNLDIDILDLFLKYAKKSNIDVYAWINPYRISTNTDISLIKDNNPAYTYLNTNNVKVVENKGIYYNPSSDVVKNLIISGILEIIDKYEVKGIIFDDYFYPSDDIDNEDYLKVKDNISIKDYHLEQVNDLIKKVYKAIKDKNKNIKFGISPNGNIDNNYNMIYADVKRWMSEKEYIDFIMPQIYYGFNNEIKPFIKTVNEWNSLINNDIRLIVALSLYKSGTIDNYAKSGINEWVDNNDIIKREIEYSRTLSNYEGFSLFRYRNLVDHNNSNLEKEVENYLKIIKSN